MFGVIRHWIDKFVPDAAKTLGINVDTPDEFYRALAAARGREAELQKQKPPIEPGDSKTKVELSYGQGSKKK